MLFVFQVNNSDDQISKLATSYTAHDVEYFRKVVRVFAFSEIRVFFFKYSHQVYTYNTKHRDLLWLTSAKTTKHQSTVVRNPFSLNGG